MTTLLFLASVLAGSFQEGVYTQLGASTILRLAEENPSFEVVIDLGSKPGVPLEVHRSRMVAIARETGKQVGTFDSLLTCASPHDRSSCRFERPDQLLVRLGELKLHETDGRAVLEIMIIAPHGHRHNVSTQRAVLHRRGGRWVFERWTDVTIG